MELEINNSPYEVPFDLSEIPLGKYIGYYEAYGRDLDNRLKEILERDYKKILSERGFATVSDDDIQLNRDIDLDSHLDEEALAWFSFWTEHDFFEVKEQPFIEPLLTQYRIFRHITDESMKQAVDFPQEINWNDSLWSIQDFKVNPASEMNFNEIITSKEVMRQIHKIGKGKWDALPYLCAIFLRKKSERFTDDLVAEGSERLKLFEELPMTIALQVAFFLTGCVNTWSKPSAYSQEKDPETASLS